MELIGGVYKQISFERRVRKAAWVAGRELYGEELSWGSYKVTMRKLSERIRDLIKEECAEEVVHCTDTYEYAFFMDGTGIDCADELVLQERLMRDSHICLYHPECGIDVLEVDIDMEEIHKIIREECNY